MKFSRWIFTIAGIYGVIVVLPQYFLEHRFAKDLPPALTHPEHFYGFIGVTLAWQFVYLLIGTDPIRYRPVMLIAMFAKLSFGIACMVLYLQGRLAPIVLAASSVDLLLVILFGICFWMTRNRKPVL
ncbi:MAG TPA: hypothetical protein VH815_09030 [Acidobacteriota bacterium]